MNPIFSYVDPVLLFREVPSYNYLLFILYAEEDSEFGTEFRRHMGRYHVDSGKDIGLFIFDTPTDKWFKDNFQYFLSRYQRSSTHEDWKMVMKEISQEARDRTRWLKLLRDFDELRTAYMNKFMQIFNMRDSNLPALLIFMRRNPATYYLESRIEASHIDHILHSLTSQPNFSLSPQNLQELPDRIRLSQIIAMLSDNLSPQYWNVVNTIHALQVQKDKARKPLRSLLSEFPEFGGLKYPEKFEWHRELPKWLRKYRDLVGKFVKQLNVLIENPENNGLGLESVRYFYRFRVTAKYRSHFFEYKGKKICYFLGYHDYELR